MKRIRNAFMAAVFCAPALVAGGAEIASRLVTAELIDDDTGKALQGATFVARENSTSLDLSLRFPGQHGGGSSGPSCIRAIARTSALPGPTRLELPAVEVHPREKLKIMGTDLQLFAYLPGFCIAEAGKKAEVRSWIPARDGRADVTSTIDPRTGRATLRTRRDTSHPEQRIRYLRRMAVWVHLCGQTDSDVLGVRRAIESEVKSLEASLPLAKRGRGFAIVPEGTDVRGIDWDAMNGICIPGDTCYTALGPPRYPREGAPPQPVRPKEVAASPSTPLKVVCRDPAKCDFDRRYLHGRTALYDYIRAADVARVKLLLAAGADPNVMLYPGGPTGIDALIDRGIGIDRDLIAPAAAVVRALAADGRVTISPRAARGLHPSHDHSPELLKQLDEFHQVAGAFPRRAPALAICRPVTHGEHPNHDTEY